MRELKFKSLDDLLGDIGLGNRPALLVARHLVPPAESGAGVEPVAATGQPLAIRGTEGMVVAYAKCCRPIPGDRILGYVSAGRGVVIHAESCKNVTVFRKHPEKWIEVEWAPGVVGEFAVDIRVEVANQRGALATLAAAIAERGANIENVGIEEHDGMYTAINFTIAVHDRVHLARIMRRLRAVPIVVRIARARG